MSNPLDLFPDGASFLDGSGERYTLVGISSVFVAGEKTGWIEVPFWQVEELIRQQAGIRAAPVLDLDVEGPWHLP